MTHEPIDWRKYILVLIITGVIFITAIYISNYFSNKKLQEVRTIQDKISIDILSSETQFSLLEETSCKYLSTDALSQEIGNLEDKLAYTEKDRGTDDPEVLTLKRYYTLLQIKDYILMNKISEKCHKTPLSIIYFYSNKGDCSDCEKEGYVLTALRAQYPDLRVYAFDYNLDLSAIRTFISINKVQNKLPALFIKDDAYYGFQSIDDIRKAIPELKLLDNASSTATSTKKK